MDNSCLFPVYGMEEIGIFLETACERAKKNKSFSMEEGIRLCEEAESLLLAILELQGPYMLEIGRCFSVYLGKESSGKGSSGKTPLGKRSLREGDFPNLTLRMQGDTLTFRIPLLSMDEEDLKHFSYRQGPKQRAAYVKLLNRSLREKNLQIEKMFESKRFLLNFLAHELRNPLTALLNGVSLLELDPESAKEPSFAKMLKNSGEDMKRLVDEVLEFAKIEGGVLGFDINPCEVESICKNFCRRARTMTESEGLEWREKGLEALQEERIRVDEFRLRQVFNNLLGNALKFTNEGHIEFSVRTSESEVVFQLRDTGKGIDKKFQAEIFEEFSQESASISKDFGGSGLGLNICYRLIKAMDGELSFDSAKGEGSAFSIKFPLAE